jgi:hypothetical protein
MTSHRLLPSLKSTNSLGLAIGLCWCALATTSTASEQQPHQHGHAQLQMAVESNNVDLILTSPAYNLLGFEHEPRTEQQKKTLENARRWLTTQALITPAGSNCAVESASMDFTVKAAEQDHHDHDETLNKHANIKVSQVLNCKGADISGQLTTSLIAQFPEIQELDVEWVTSRRQGSTKLSSSDNRFQL